MSRASRNLVAAALALAVAPVAHGQTPAEESAEQLAAPSAPPQAVLETGSGLGRPPPSVPGAMLVPADPAWEHAPMRRAAIELRVLGPLGPRLRSMISTDLAYVPEVGLDDDGDLVLVGLGTGDGEDVSVELALARRGGPAGGVLRRNYTGSEAGLTRFVHEFVDDAVETITGTRSAFSATLLFARRVGPGRKDVMTADLDGAEISRLSSGEGVATLPSFGSEGVFYTRVTPTGVFITRTGAGEEPVIGGPGSHMGAVTCDGRLYFSSTREGNTDIWSAAPDGTDQRRLTTHPAIEVSPTCASEGRIAFVSDRSGSPQIWVMAPDGSGQEQVTRQAGSTQTPAWCGDRLAFTAMGGGQPMRVVVMDLRTGATRRISPPGGRHKDPAFSPDCRMIAWVSPQGVEVATWDGRNRRLVVPGAAETVRWGRLPE